jgi:signal transduction histidine kinase
VRKSTFANGSRVPVLVARAVFEWNRDEGVAFVFDLTERKHVEGALRDAQANLAHVVRVTPWASWRPRSPMK